jgi:hypothetical protein
MTPPHSKISLFNQNYTILSTLKHVCHFKKQGVTLISFLSDPASPQYELFGFRIVTFETEVNVGIIIGDPNLCADRGGTSLMRFELDEVGQQRSISPCCIVETSIYPRRIQYFFWEGQKRCAIGEDWANEAYK